MVCEVLFIIAVSDGGLSLKSDCMPDLHACWDRGRTEVHEHPQSAGAWQCVEIGALVDNGREPMKERQP